MSVTMKSGGLDIKIVSFDVDGTLVSPDFVNAVWLEGIPRAYAAENNIDFNHAYNIIIAAYDEIGENRIEWYDLKYWLRRFNLKISIEDLFNQYKDRVKIYEDVEHVLNALKNAGYELIICSNAAREFIFFQTKRILHYFSHVFSATSDFKEVKKSREFYARICEILGVRPYEVVHIGDHPVFDFKNPIEAGMNALLLSRHQKSEGQEDQSSTKSEMTAGEMADEMRDGAGRDAENIESVQHCGMTFAEKKGCGSLRMRIGDLYEVLRILNVL